MNKQYHDDAKPKDYHSDKVSSFSHLRHAVRVRGAQNSMKKDICTCTLKFRIFAIVLELQITTILAIDDDNNNINTNT